MKGEAGRTEGQREAWATLKITAVYLAIGGLWVLFTNRILLLLAADPQAVTRLQSFKGWIYILATGWMLHVLIYRSMLALRSSSDALAERKPRLRAMISAFDGHICVSSPDGRIEFMNDNLVRRTGRDAHGELCHRVVHGLDRPCPWCPRERVLRGETVRTEVLSPKDQRWYYSVYTPMRHADGSLSCNAMLLDITEGKLAAEGLRESERFLSDVFESIQDGVSVLDSEFNIVRVNRTMKQWYAHAQPLEGRKCYEVYQGRTSPCEPCPTMRALRTGQLERNEVPLTQAGGVTGAIELFAFPMLDDAGKATGVVEYVRDVSERKRAEAERDRLAMAVEHAAEAIFVTDTRGIIQYVNPAFEKVTGYARDEALGKPYGFLGTGEEEKRFFRDLQRDLLRNGLWEGRVTKKKKDGAPYEACVTVSPMRDSQGRIVSYVAVSRDVTHEVELEKQFLQAQKMESVVQVASGIAHDFNNYLTTILGSSRMLLDGLAANDPLRQEIGEIVHAGEGAVRLTQQLLSLSRRKPPSLQQVCLDDVVLRSDPLLRRVAGKRVEFETLLGGGGVIEADPGQIEQLLMNLVVNARDAMPGGGRLTVETREALLGARHCRARIGVRPGGYALLMVRDTGQGMSRDVREHAFEPFFSTKKEGQGTGLGLTSVYGIVQQHRGYIELDSRPAGGTEFRIFFPQIGPGHGNEA